MKNLFKYMFAAALSAAAMTACSTDATEEAVAPELEGKSFKIVASFDDTRATIDDISALQWAVGDQLDVRQYTIGGGSHEYRSNALTAEGIVDGHATFEFGHLITDSPALFMYGMNGGAVWKSEFNFYPNMTQAAAGTMNKEYLKLLSDPVEISTVGANSYEAKMNIVGTVLRFIIYSGTGARAEEKVQSVKMVSTETNLFGLIAYDFVNGGFWRYENQEPSGNPDCEIFYFPAKSATVTLTEPMPLDTEDAASSLGKGIYLPVPPIAITGYQYVVTTDQAVYTFDASTKATTFADNTLKNVMLDIEKATSRLGEDDFKGYIYYDGGPGNATVDAVAGSLNSIGYTVARVSDPNGENWNMSTEQVGRDEYLYNATYVYYDESDNVIAPEDSWLTVDFSPLNICHWRITYEENTAVTPRSIKVVGTLTAPKGYTLVAGQNLEPKTYTYTFTITQKANIVVEAQLSDVYAETVPAAGDTIEAGKLALTVNGVEAVDIAATMAEYGVTVEAGAATPSVAADGTITLEVPENLYNEARTYVLNVKFDGKVIATCNINQAEGEQEMPYIYNYTFGAWSGAQGTEVTLNLPASGKDGEWLVVFNSVTLKSGEALSSENLDKYLLLSQVFHGEHTQYDWITYDLDGPLNDLRIRAYVKPNTGERRTAVLYAYLSDGTDSWWRKITINQDPGI